MDTSLQTLAAILLTFLAGLVLGIGSAWYMIDSGSPLTTARTGPWASWTTEGNPTADSYTKAHLARSGRLPLTSTTARYFLASTDSSGQALTSSCEYTIEGAGLDARWWSLAVYGEDGNLIANPSQRYSFNSQEIVRHGDGTYRINLARYARPENWLPTGTGPARNLILMLHVYVPRETDADGVGNIPPDRLPKIERKTCE